MGSKQNRNLDSGFTLIELLVSVVLTGFVVFAVSQSVLMVSSSSVRLEDHFGKAANLQVVYRQFKQDLHSTFWLTSSIPVFGSSSEYQFNGFPESLAFVAKGGPTGLRTITYQAGPGGLLLRKEAPLFPGQVEAGQQEETVSQFSDFTAPAFSYADTNGYWMTYWTQKTPPAAVKVELAWARDDDIPGESVPPLIIDIPIVSIAGGK